MLVVFSRSVLSIRQTIVQGHRRQAVAIMYIVSFADRRTVHRFSPTAVQHLPYRPLLASCIYHTVGAGSGARETSYDVHIVEFTPPFAFHHQEGRQRRSAKGEGRSAVSSLPPATALVTSCLCATAAVACMKHGYVRRMPLLLHRSKHQRCPRTPLVLSVCTMTRHDRWAVAAIAQQQ